MTQPILYYPGDGNVPVRVPYDWERCTVCEQWRDQLCSEGACEDCTQPCDFCGDSFHPDLLVEVEGGFECEVCCDAREAEAAWIKENL
jgi:hypothetical protein